jgi:hypothetical protein
MVIIVGGKRFKKHKDEKAERKFLSGGIPRVFPEVFLGENKRGIAITLWELLMLWPEILCKLHSKDQCLQALLASTGTNANKNLVWIGN